MTTSTTIPPELEALTPKQRAFVLEYLKNKNGTQAAKKAGYKGNTATLSAVAVENLRKPLVIRAIEAIEKPIVQKALVTVERVVNELATIGFAVPDGDLKYRDKIAALKLCGDHVGAFKLANDGETPQGIAIIKTMGEQEVREYLASLLKKR